MWHVSHWSWLALGVGCYPYSPVGYSWGRVLSLFACGILLPGPLLWLITTVLAGLGLLLVYTLCIIDQQTNCMISEPASAGSI